MADSRTSKSKFVIALLIAVVAIAAVVVWQATDGDDDPQRTAQAQPHEQQGDPGAKKVITDPTAPGYDAAAVPTISAAQPAERANFALLRAEPDGMPAKAVQVMGKPLYGLNPDLAKRIPVDVPAKYGKFWFAPANGLMCVVAHNYATHRVNLKCALTKDALTKGVRGTFIQIKGGGANWGSMTKQLIVGVAPDGVRKAHMQVGAERVTLPVVDNVFSYTARSHENPRVTYEPSPSPS